jgi:quinolinate synthase
MKMNSLAALMSVCNRVGSDAERDELPSWKPKPYEERINGKSMAQAGCRSILHMRSFQKNGSLSSELVEDMRSRVR